MSNSGKVVIVGDGAVGKTFLLTALLADPESDPIDWDNPKYEPTANRNNSVEWEYSDPEGGIDDFNLEVWDTAGQEVLRSLRMMAYPDTDIFILAYDMTREVTLENIVGCELTKLNTFSLEDEDSDDEEYVSSWMSEINQGCMSDFKVILIGTKADFWEEKMAEGDSKGMTTWQQGYDVARAIGAAAYIQTSAKTMQGISEAVDNGIGGPADKQVDPEGVWLKDKILEIRYKQINNHVQQPLILPTVEKVAPRAAAVVPPAAKDPAVPAARNSTSLAMDANLATQVQMAIMEVPGLIEEVRETLGSDVSNSDLRRFIEEIVRASARELFDNLDLDGDGVITMREVGKAFRGKRKDELRNMVSMHGMDWRDFEDGLYEVPTNPDGSIGFEAFEDYLDQKGGPAEPEPKPEPKPVPVGEQV